MSTESALMEEYVYLMLHEVVDAATSTNNNSEVYRQLSRVANEKEDEEALPSLPSSPPLVSNLVRVSTVPRLSSMPPIPKRRRLGVNSDAHDQILLLRANLAMVKSECDDHKARFKALEQEVADLKEEKRGLESRIEVQAQLIRFHRDRLVKEAEIRQKSNDEQQVRKEKEEEKMEDRIGDRLEE